MWSFIVIVYYTQDGSLHGQMYALDNLGQPCLTLLTSYTRITYDIYNTIGINETLINNFFATILQLLYWIFMQLPNY